MPALYLLAGAATSTGQTSSGLEGPFSWERYSWQILTGVLLLVLQTILITALLAQHSRRAKAVRQLRQRESDLRRHQEEIHGLAGKLLTAREDERRLIARRLHDDLSQHAATIGIAVSSLRRKAAKSPAAPPVELAQLWDTALSLSEGLRDLSHQLHPALLEHMGLVAALRAHCEEFTRASGISVLSQMPSEILSIQPDVALCLYRIAQEALRNVAKYSGAHQASLVLSKADGEIRLTIADSGRGFDVAEARRRGGLGLTSMQERAKLVGGELFIDSAPNQGARVVARVPRKSKAPPVAPMAHRATVRWALTVTKGPA